VSQKRERLLHRVLQEVPGSAARCHVTDGVARGMMMRATRSASQFIRGILGGRGGKK